ncbi:MAG: GIY-YIG nuclease family protein [Patescibacteria group bacterium]
MSYYVYFLKSIKNNKIYTGYTKIDPILRIKQHNQGTDKWTKENGPFLLLYYEKYCCKKDAILREKFYKTGIGRRIHNAIISSVSAKGGPAFGGG